MPFDNGTLCRAQLSKPGPSGMGIGICFAKATESVDAAEKLPVQVTEEMIRNAVRDAPLLSQQSGGVSLPRVQEFVDRLRAGEVAPAIKVDGKMIVEGNHRYIAARILGQEPAIQQWLGGRPENQIPWSELKIDPKSW